MNENKDCVEKNYLTTKEMQLILKRALNKVERLDFEHRIGITAYDGMQIEFFRRQC